LPAAAAAAAAFDRVDDGRDWHRATRLGSACARQPRKTTVLQTPPRLGAAREQLLLQAEMCLSLVD